MKTPQTQSQKSNLPAMEEFFTRPRANAGVEMPLRLPDGTETKHWLRLCGIDSDAYREAESGWRRELMDISAKEDEAKKKEQPLDEVAQKVVRHQAYLRLIASFVMGWSFEIPCTPDKVVEFLDNSPQIVRQIDQFTSDRSLFFAKK